VKKTLAIVLLVIAAAVGADRLRAQTATHLYKVKETDDVYALPPPGYVNAMSLGYRDVVASILWASTLYQYGEHVGQNRRFQYSTQYLRTILELDPGFRPAYRFASAIVTMQAVSPSREELEITKQLLEQGTRELPSDPEVWGARASFLMFEGAQFLDEETKAAWRVQGAPAATRAVELGYVMDTLAITGSIFLERAGERDLAIAQLERAYAVAPTEDTRDKIAARLRRLQAQEALSRVERVQRFLLGRWRDEAPWLNEGLFVLMGPQRNAAACAGVTGIDPRCAPGWTGALAQSEK
jgi:tetratricopeptide (TPR) repeat protein